MRKQINPRGSRKREASAATTMEASATTTLDRDNPIEVLKAYDQIIAKNKSLSADVESGEKELGRQLKEISKMKQEISLSKELYGTSITMLAAKHSLN